MFKRHLNLPGNTQRLAVLLVYTFMYFHYFHYYDYIYVYNGLLLFLCGCQTCCFQAHLPGGGPDHHRHCRLFRVPQAESQWMALRCRTDGSVLSQVLGKVPDGRDGPLCTPAAGFKNAATHSTINMCYLVLQYNYILYIYILFIYILYIYNFLHFLHIFSA